MQSYVGLKIFIKSKIGVGKQFPGVPNFNPNPPEFSSDSVASLMRKYKKGSAMFRKVIMRERSEKSNNHPFKPINWITKLQDNTITFNQVKMGHKSIHSKYLMPKVKDTLIKYYNGKTMFNINKERAGILDDEEGICLSVSDRHRYPTTDII